MSQVANTAIHPLSYPFTMDYEVPHGFACAVFLPAFIRHNADSVREIFSDVLAMLGLASPEAFADEVEGLMERLQAPTRLGEFGVEDGLLPEMVKRGIGKSTDWNPRPLEQEDLLEICRSIL
jgi:alcohol dehydrogenase class IV